MEQGGPRAAVPLQRGLARILLAAGERHAAIEAYRGILAVEPDGADDRVALAEIYAMEDLPKAIQEIHRVLDRDLRHAPAYRLLASLYERTSEPERALRVNGILELLGYSDDSERVALASARARHAFVPRRSLITDDFRDRMLLPAAARSPLTEIYQAVSEQVATLHLMPPAGQNLVPVAQHEDPTLKVAVADATRLFGLEPEVYVGDQVHGGMIVLLYPRPIITLSREYAALPDGERRFLMGRAFESMRGGYAPLLRLGPRERQEVGALLKAMLMPEADRPSQAVEFIKQLPRKALKPLERYTGMHQAVDPEAWIAALSLAQDRAGLLTSDDFPSTARALARLHGEQLAMTEEGAVAIGAVPGGSDLVRWYLSDDYHRLRTALL
jgi:tetratricopeptide (TPR) repeat protein